MDLATSTGGTGYLCQPLSIPRQFTGGSRGLAIRDKMLLKTRRKTRRPKRSTMAKASPSTDLIQVGLRGRGPKRRTIRRKRGRGVGKKSVIKRKSTGRKGNRKRRRGTKASKGEKARRRRKRTRRAGGAPKLPENF